MSEYKTHGFLYKFALRWLICGLGLWIAAALLSQRISFEPGVSSIILSGLVLAIVNSLVKPLVVLLSFPAIALTLGLFMVVINGLMVMLASSLYGGMSVSGLGAAMLAGIIIGLVNYSVTAIIEER